MIDRRLLFLWIFGLGTLFVLVLGLFFLQIKKGSYYAHLSRRNCIKNIDLSAPRGDIYDRNHRLLVTNKPSFNIVFMKKDLKKYPRTVQRIAKIMKKKTADLWDIINASSQRSFLPELLFEDISRQQLAVIEENFLKLPGIFVSVYPKRHYLYKKIGGHVLGYVGKLNAREFKKFRSYGYHKKDIIGKNGLELLYESYLRGKSGGQQVQVNSLGQIEKKLTHKCAEKGKNLITTLDINIQKIVEKALSRNKGAVIVTEPFSSEILALASSPSFDPNVFVSSESRKTIQKLIFNRKERPLFNRAIGMSVSPGSIFKIFMGLTFLMEKKILPSTELFCSGSHKVGRVFHCWKKFGHGTVRIRKALSESCNVFFYKLTQKMSIDTLVFYTKKFGFGKKTGIDLPFEKSGFVPSRSWKKRRFHQSWYPGETINFSIGQGYLLTTPLQLLHNFNSIFHEKFQSHPHLVKKITDHKQKSFDHISSRRRIFPVEKQYVKTVFEGMKQAVNHNLGSAKIAALPDIVVSGKTGTVQVVGEKQKRRFKNRLPEKFRNHAWFLGFAPFDNPQVSVIVFLEHGESGGEYASKVAQNIFKNIFDLPSYSLYRRSSR